MAVRSNDSDTAQASTHYYMYVVACADGTWYTGYTNDVERRVAAHNAGRGAKYTRSRRPVTLVACAQFATEHEARSAEWHFKRLTRAQKEQLVMFACNEETGEVNPQVFANDLARFLPLRQGNR